ncbi:MAG: hypothetical protein NT126_00065 [Bacteroidetes bacterium]|nr:hypothetical protein [Bacteroidota bacterium]
MKKIIYSTLTLSVLLLFASSCRKENNGVIITKVIPVQLNVNQSYSYEVPRAGDDDDDMQITKQATHFLMSQVSASTGTNVLFEYTPALNFTGTDEVILNNAEGSHGHGGHGNGHGNCGGSKPHHDDTIIYDFQITVTGTTTRSQ